MEDNTQEKPSHLFSSENQPERKGNNKEWWSKKKAEKEIRNKVIELFCKPIVDKKTGDVLMAYPLEELVKFIQVNIFNTSTKNELSMSKRMEYAFKFLAYASAFDNTKDTDSDVISEERIELVRRTFEHAEVEYAKRTKCIGNAGQ